MLKLLANLFIALALSGVEGFAAEPISIRAPRPIVFTPVAATVVRVRIPLAPLPQVTQTHIFRFDTGSGLWVPRSLNQPIAFAPAASALSADSAPEVFASAASEDFAEGLLFARDKAKAPASPLPPSPSPYSDAQIVDMATQLAKSYKGSPWSYTEYNSVLYPTLDSLRNQGVPPRQIELFKKTCDDYPGRPFNPWSGD